MSKAKKKPPVKPVPDNYMNMDAMMQTILQAAKVAKPAKKKPRS